MTQNNAAEDAGHRTCPRCQTVNYSRVEKCSKCALDFSFLDYILACFSGNIPADVSSSVVLKPGEVAYYHSQVNMLAQKTEVISKRNYTGSRVKFAGLPIYFGQSRPQKESSEIRADVGSGEFVMTNERIIIVGNKANFHIELSQITNFEFYSNAIQIFCEGPHGGIIYEIDNPWRLWVLLFTKLKIAPGNLQLKTTDPSQLGEEKEFVLHICEQIEESQKTVKYRDLRKTFLESNIATIVWLIAFPPFGFYCLYRNSSLCPFAKIIFGCVGLYLLTKWAVLFR